MEVFPTIEIIDRLYAPPGQESASPFPSTLTEEDLKLALRRQVRHAGDLPRRPAARLAGPRQSASAQNWFDVGAGPGPAGGGRRPGPAGGDSASGRQAAGPGRRIPASFSARRRLSGTGYRVAAPRRVRTRPAKTTPASHRAGGSRRSSQPRKLAAAAMRRRSNRRPNAASPRGSRDHEIRPISSSHSSWARYATCLIPCRPTRGGSR